MALENTNTGKNGLDKDQKKSILDLLKIKGRSKKSDLTEEQNASIMNLLNKKNKPEEGGLTEDQRKSVMDFLNKSKSNTKEKDKEEKNVNSDHLNSSEENEEEVKSIFKEEKQEDIKKEEIKTTDDAKKKALEALRGQKAAIVNIDEIAEAEARKAADAYMTESKESLKGFKGFVKKIWKHTFFDEYYRQREVNRVREEIKNTGDIYSRRVNNNKVAHESAMQGISERFASDYEKTLSEGEEKKVLNNANPEAVKITSDIKNLINQYASGTLDEGSFKSEKDRLLLGLKDTDILTGSGKFADNLFEIAKNARLAVEHGAKIEELEFDTNVIIGKAKSSLKTEAHFNWVDKGIDKMKKSHIGRFVSPAVLSTAVGIAYSISVGAGKKLMSSKAAAWGTFGAAVLVSSAFAGANESQRVALERKQHGIEMAEGGEYKKGDKRREQMARYEYQMENSTDLAENLRSLMFEKDKYGKDVIKDIKKEDLDLILASLSDIEARNSLNVRNKIDLISYSNIGNVEKERTDLTILTARAKVELRKKLEGGLTNGKFDAQSFDDYLKKQTAIIEDSLLGGEKGINAQDKAFRKYKASRVVRKMAQTAVMGLLIGGTIQEGVAFLKDDVQGAVEGIFHHDVGAINQTPVESFHHLIMGSSAHMDMNHMNPFDFNGHTLNLPEGTSLINNGDGTCDILRGGEVVSSHFTPTFDASGALDADSIDKLGQDGIFANTTHHIINSTQEVESDARGWMQNHQGETIQVHHNNVGPFMDNDTPMYPDPENPGHLLGADGNELGMHWGGINGTGINENGDAVLNISHMDSVHSVHGDISVNVPDEMQKGNLMAIIYLDGSAGGRGIPVPVGTDGNIIFDHNNPIMQQIFTQDANGQMVNHAKVIELVQKMGVDENGVQQVRAISAIVGEGLNNIKDTVPCYEDVVINKLSPSLGAEMPYFIPVVARRPLEPVAFGKKDKQQEKDHNENKKKEIPYPYYGGEMDRQKWRDDFSPRLKNNHEAELNPKEEIDWYFEDQKRRYPGYVEKELKNLEDQNPKKLGKGVEAIACVAAAGHQEYNNIYKTLKTYAIQKYKNGESVWRNDEDDNKFEIFLFVNWPKGKDPQKTFEEIDRFKNDYPNVKIRVYKEEITGGKVELGWIKKKIFDLALRKHQERNNGKDIKIITNDADMTFISPTYLEDANDTLDDPKNKKVDGVLGRFDLDPEVYIKNPTFHTIMKFWQFMESVMRSKYGMIGSQGRNTIMRGSSYAAVGGNRTKEFWADIEFAQLFDDARGRSSMLYSNKAWVNVDPRREIDKFKSGEMVAYTWGGDFDTRNVRGVENGISEDLDIMDLYNLSENDQKVIDFKKRLEEELSEIVNLFSRITPGYISAPAYSGIDKKYYADIKMLAERASGFLGMSINVEEVGVDENGNSLVKVKIIDSKKLREDLKNYKEENKDKIKLKTT
jgi:hypothetical protein